MKAIYINDYGGSSKLILGEQQKPQLKNDQVLIKVKAAAVNPRDWIIREGKYVFKQALPKFPIIIGSDVSGKIVSIGKNVQNYEIGDAVFGMQPLNGGMGAYAEYVAIKASAIAHKPDNISFVEAAAVPCAGLTAWMAVTKIGQVKPGQKVTICGASGGVGTYALQFAKARGAFVTGVCGPGNIDLVKKLGADEVVNYKVAHYSKVTQNQDLIFDAVGRDSFSNAIQALNKTGRYVSTIPTIGSVLTALKSNMVRKIFRGNRRSSHLVLVRAFGHYLEEIAELIQKEKVCSVIDSVYPLEQAKQAQEKSRTWHASGKIVLEIG